MISKAITFIFVGTMLATGIFSGMAFAATDNSTTFEDRQERLAMKHEERLGMMAEVLDLSESQLEEIRAIHEQERTDMDATRQQLHQGLDQMRALLEADSLDEGAIRRLANSQASLKTEMFVPGPGSSTRYSNY
jgi:Spy/CpxP family protein refolding chaperone